jgi:hypothetical protein
VTETRGRMTIKPPMTCPECGAQMEFNDFPERYFSFVTG